MNKLISMLSRLPMRVVAVLGAVLLGVVVWLISKLFPGVDHRTIAIVGAFAIAVIFAIGVRPRRQF